MASVKKDLNLRSDEIQEIMSRQPTWIIRWGITAIFLVIVFGLFLCWLIRYPEIISGSVKITSVIPPVKIVTLSGGNITQLMVKDGEEVKAGTVLAELENPMSANAVKYIKDYLSQLERAIRMNSEVLPVPDTNGVALGDLQSVFNELQKEISSINLRKSYRIDDAELSELKLKVAHQKELISINKRMLDIYQKELINAKVKYESDAALYRDKVLSKQEYFQSQTEYNNKQLQLEQLQQTQVQNTVILNNLELQLNQAGFNKNAKETGTMESVKTLQKTISNYIYGWQQRFRLVAVADGKVSYLKNLQTNMFLKSGEEVFALLQPDDSLVAYAEIPVAGFGKVKTGQRVNLSLENFPYEEYGVVNGNVQNIALLPNSSFYRVAISLPQGMQSTQGTILKYTPEMTGIAEIVTDDKTVIERIFKSILKVFKKK